MRRALLVLALAGCAGCDFKARAAAEAKHADMERRIAELDVRIARLENENDLLRAELETLRRSGAATAVPSAAPAEGPSCTGSGTSFSITRADVDAIFGDTSSLAMQARVVPAFENGVAKGFKLFAIRPGSFYASCGFMNGDVVTSVNGHELTSPDKALTAYSKLKGTSRADIAIQRTGKPLVLTINVEG